MTAWISFWASWLLISGLAFAAITLIVAVKGFQDLRAMFAGLRGREKERD